MSQKSYSLDGRPNPDNADLVNWYCGMCGDKSGYYKTLDECRGHIQLAHKSGSAHPTLRNDKKTRQIVSMLLSANGLTLKDVPNEQTYLDMMGFHSVFIDDEIPSIVTTTNSLKTSVESSGISSDLLQRLRTTLLRCGPFENDSALRTIFIDERISIWCNALPESDSREKRVNNILDFLHKWKNDAGDNALVLFLRVLSDSKDLRDACKQNLVELAEDLAQALQI